MVVKSKLNLLQSILVVKSNGFPRKLKNSQLGQQVLTEILIERICCKPNCHHTSDMLLPATHFLLLQSVYLFLLLQIQYYAKLYYKFQFCHAIKLINKEYLVLSTSMWNIPHIQVKPCMCILNDMPMTMSVDPVWCSGYQVEYQVSDLAQLQTYL